MKSEKKYQVSLDDNYQPYGYTNCVVYRNTRRVSNRFSYEVFLSAVLPTDLALLILEATNQESNIDNFLEQ